MRSEHRAWALAMALQVAVSAWASDDVPEMVAQSLSPVVPVAVVYQPRVVYPEVLLRSGNKGGVKVDFTVDEHGRAEDLSVTHSPHPAFEQAAVDAVLHSRFRPATLDGLAIKCQTAQPFMFKLATSGLGRDTGFEPFVIPSKADSALPEEFQYDKPPRIRVLAPLVYPFELLLNKVTGSAEVLVTIDPTGRVQAVKVLSATDVLFGLATKALMSTTRFEPATKDGQGRWFVLKYKQNFSLRDRDLIPSYSGQRLLIKARQHSEDGIYRMDRLDVPLKAVYRPEPIFPPELQKANIQGQVMVEFYIDKEGHTQWPRVVKADHEELGAIAVTAVKRWHFEPPRVKGEVVDALVRVPLTFELPAP